jgi:hypothetical protein
MSDTPITDANCFGKAAFGDDEKMVSVHVARRLEKSRTPLAEVVAPQDALSVARSSFAAMPASAVYTRDQIIGCLDVIRRSMNSTR